MKEIWKDIPEYEGLYQVSNYGRVRRILFVNNIVTKPKIKILSLCVDKKGYLRVCLNKNGKRKNMQVHRIVALAFISNPDNLPEVNHKDENPKNNCVENLEWCTHLYNMNYGNIRQKIRNKIILKKVNQYDLDGNFIKTWDSVLEIKKILNISKQCISYCCLGKTNSAGGYRWEYINE